MNSIVYDEETLLPIPDLLMFICYFLLFSIPSEDG